MELGHSHPAGWSCRLARLTQHACGNVVSNASEVPLHVRLQGSLGSGISGLPEYENPKCHGLVLPVLCPWDLVKVMLLQWFPPRLGSLALDI